MVGDALANVAVVFWESLEGLEVRHNSQCAAVLRDYQTFRQMTLYPSSTSSPINGSSVRALLSHIDSDALHMG